MAFLVCAPHKRSSHQQQRIHKYRVNAARSSGKRQRVRTFPVYITSICFWRSAQCSGSFKCNLAVGYAPTNRAMLMCAAHRFVCVSKIVGYIPYVAPCTVVLYDLRMFFTLDKMCKSVFIHLHMFFNLPVPGL